MGAPHASHSQAGHGDAGHAHVHELSIWPLMLGIAALLFYFGAVYRGALTVLGVLALLGAFGGWYYEDHKRAKRPHHVEAWNAKGKHVLWWGMVFFLCTEVMLFGGLFASYFAGKRFWTPETVPHLPVGLTAISTAILVASGFAYHYGLHALRKNNRKGFIGGLALTLLLGGIFLGFQVNEYRHLLHDGFTLSSGMYMTNFFMLTGTHGFHVLTGLVMILILFIRGIAGDFSAERDVAVDSVGLYWHFVDVVWLILYVIVYLKVI